MANFSGYGNLPVNNGIITPPKPTLHGFAQFDKVEHESFGNTIAQMVGKANDIMAQPEKLTLEATTNGNVDIHQISVALGKSEVAFKLITSMTQKVIGGFEKLISMQV